MHVYVCVCVCVCVCMHARMYMFDNLIPFSLARLRDKTWEWPGDKATILPVWYGYTCWVGHIGMSVFVFTVI